MAAGAPRYVMRLTLISDFDGYLPEPEPGETAQRLLQAIEQEAASASEEDLLEGVILTRAFLLCPPCRTRIARDPLQRGDGEGPAGRLQ